jgi:putative membrane protein
MSSTGQTGQNSRRALDKGLLTGRRILARLQSASIDVTKPTVALLVAWVLVMVATPILIGVFGPNARPWVIMVGVTAQTAAVLSILHYAWGTSRTLRAGAAVALLAWAAEYIGSQTGFPFGHYAYSALLQPQLGHVPLVIPFAWLMMLPAAWAVASRLVGTRRLLPFTTVSAIALTAWDLFLDPQMVAWGFWEWASPGGYFGIPWVNFLGWFLVGGLVTAVVRPGQLPEKPLLIVYGVTWALETIGLLVFWQLPGPALVGFAVMGVLLVLAVRARGSA